MRETATLRVPERPLLPPVAQRALENLAHDLEARGVGREIRERAREVERQPREALRVAGGLHEQAALVAAHRPAEPREPARRERRGELVAQELRRELREHGALGAAVAHRRAAQHRDDRRPRTVEGPRVEVPHADAQRGLVRGRRQRRGRARCERRLGVLTFGRPGARGAAATAG